MYDDPELDSISDAEYQRDLANQENDDDLQQNDPRRSTDRLGNLRQPDRM